MLPFSLTTISPASLICRQTIKGLPICGTQGNQTNLLAKRRPWKGHLPGFYVVYPCRTQQKLLDPYIKP